MKKYFYCIAIIFMAVMSLTACSDDDDDVNITSPVVGTWGTGYRSLGIYSTLTLNSNGTVSSADYFDDEVYRDNGTYDVSGNTITIDWSSDDEQVIMHFTLSDNNNTMTTTMVGESGSTTWERVK